MVALPDSQKIKMKFIGNVAFATLCLCLILSISAQLASAESMKCEKPIEKIEKIVMGAHDFTLNDLPFTYLSGEQGTLEDYRGKVVVLNHWAMWCAPCITEMPSLIKLSQSVAGSDISVMALSQDRGGVKKVPAFLKKNKWEGLTFAMDEKRHISRAYKLVGLPTTQIFDKSGKEVARVEGTLEWDEPEIKSYLTCLARS